MKNELPRVRVVNQNDSWLGTEYYIDGKKIEKVKRIDFSVGVEEVPTFIFETIGIPDIDMPGRVIFDYKPENVTDAIQIIRNELLKYDSLYNGFSASIASALNEHWCCGLPFEPEEDVAKKILDYMIGGEHEEKE